MVPVRLYLEDVHALYDELATATGAAHIETDEYELDGPEELLKLGRDRLSTLTLRGAGLNVFVNIGLQGAFVRRLGDEAEVIVLAEKLRQMLLGRRRKFHWLTSWWTVPLWWGLEVAGIILVYGVGGRAGLISGLVLFCLALLGVLGLFVMRLGLGSVVYLRHRRSPSFLKRHSDTLTVTGVVSLVIAVVSVLLAYYLTKK